MLLFGAESSVIQVAVQKFKDQDIYRIVILPVVLYGCETWSLTLREERRLRVFENRVLRRVFGSKRDEVTGNGENYIMKSIMKCAEHVARMGQWRSVHRVLLGKPEGKRPLVRPRHRWLIILRWTLSKEKTNLMPLILLFIQYSFNAQHVSAFNTTIFRSLRLAGCYFMGGICKKYRGIMLACYLLGRCWS